MEAFLGLLDQIHGHGVIHIECIYTPSYNERNRLPGTFESATVKLMVSVENYRGFLDWLRNDDENSLLPMKMTWTGIDAIIVVDLETEIMEVSTQNRQLLRNCIEYSQRTNMRQFHHNQELPGRGRVVRRRVDQQNWDPRR